MAAGAAGEDAVLAAGLFATWRLGSGSVGGRCIMRRMSWRMLVLVALVLASGLTLAVAWEQLARPTTPALAQADTQQVSVTDVVDGDTIDVSTQVEGTNRVRLIGVDTPEVFGGEEPCGSEASDFTTEQLEGQDVTLEFDEDRIDPYDRALAYVWVPDLDGELFNETLVRRGLATGVHLRTQRQVRRSLPGSRK